jgi:DNA (cytosine-5)-methyltransferase 1
MTMIKVASLFSGIGGFEKGFQQASVMSETVFTSEIDKYARQIYKKNFGVEPHGDITQISATEIPDHDILCGGFPCQAFSVAGKRRGFEDTRGTLFFEIMRIAEAKRPKLLFLENVKGLLSHDKGGTFQIILRSMDELGYDAEWQVFNSKDHGVPQNRERVFIIGHLRGSGTRPIFPITESSGMVDAQESTVYCLDANYYKGPAQQARTMICECGNKNLVAWQLENDPSIRRLTPMECERLQGFPDGWTEGVSDTQRYKCLGNAVTVNVVEFIAKHLITLEVFTLSYK